MEPAPHKQYYRRRKRRKGEEQQVRRICPGPEKIKGDKEKKKQHALKSKRKDRE